MLNSSTSRIEEVQDTFTRPANTTAYAQYDRIGAATTDSGTTPLRALGLPRTTNGAGFIKYIRLATDKTDFTGTIRVHLYNVAAPTTVIPGDNAAYPLVSANFMQHVCMIDLPALVLAVGTGSDIVEAVSDALNVPFTVAAGESHLYYALQIISSSALTPASAQTFKLIVRTEAY